MPFRYFSHLPMRWVEEPLLREVVCAAHGFCNAHTWLLAGMQSQVAIARVFADVLDALAEQSVARQTCPACRLGALMEDILIEDFDSWLSETGARERYGELFGVCYPHLQQLLQRDLTEGAREALLSCQEARRAGLAQSLRSFLDKNTIEARWRRTEAEIRAPRRALLKVAGSKQV
jgi:hypothetical protein